MKIENMMLAMNDCLMHSHNTFRLSPNMQMTVQLKNVPHWPVSPLGDPHSLDDVHCHLEEEDKEEEEEAEGAVGPEKQEEETKDKLSMIFSIS